MRISFVKKILFFILSMGYVFLSCAGGTDEIGSIDPTPTPQPPEEEKIALNVASYNLRLLTNADTGNKSWVLRKVHAEKIISKYDFDVFGTQELVLSQITDLLALNSSYNYTGVGRDQGDTKGEHCAIFYKKDKFELLDEGTFWLSTTPDIPSKGWDASLNRICSWGKFKEKESQKEFYFFNTHFDHVGNIARKESAKLLLSKIKSIAGNQPAFCTGDFNLKPETEGMQTLIKSNVVWDTREISIDPIFGTEGTFHGYDLSKPVVEYINRIDYIFVTTKIDVQSYGVINDEIVSQTIASDHFPVFIKAKL